MLRTSALLVGSLVAGAMVVAARPASAVDADDSIEFDTLGILAEASAINLSTPQLLRIGHAGDRDEVASLLGAGTGEYPFADDVMDAVGELQPGRVVLIGIIDRSCTPATEAGLERSPEGDLVMTAPRHVPEPIECVVAVTTVAVLSVDAADVPPGSTDHADLVAFENLGYLHGMFGAAVELTDDAAALGDIVPPGTPLPDLPPHAKDDRRFAFLLMGCANETAELVVTMTVITARFGEPSAMCDVPEFYLVVFDSPAEIIPATAELPAR
jgi:hypothetical protein